MKRRSFLKGLIGLGALALIPYNAYQGSVLAQFNHPTGTILPWAKLGIPQGWLVCDGQHAEKTKHAELYKLLGTTYGANKDSSFVLPDLRGRFVRATSARRFPPHITIKYIIKG